MVLKSMTYVYSIRIDIKHIKIIKIPRRPNCKQYFSSNYGEYSINEMHFKTPLQRLINSSIQKCDIIMTKLMVWILCQSFLQVGKCDEYSQLVVIVIIRRILSCIDLLSFIQKPLWCSSYRLEALLTIFFKKSLSEQIKFGNHC